MNKIDELFNALKKMDVHEFSATDFSKYTDEELEEVANRCHSAFAKMMLYSPEQLEQFDTCLTRANYLLGVRQNG